MILKFDSFGIIQGSTVATFFDAEESRYYYTPLEDFGLILQSGAFTYASNEFKVNETTVKVSGSFNGFLRLVFADL